MILDNLQIKQAQSKPLLNYIDNLARQKFAMEYYQIHRKKRMAHLYFRTPEAQQVIDGHARDICGSFHFEDVQPRSQNQLKINRARRFAERIAYKRRRLSWIKDALITGEGFMFISELDRSQVRAISEEFRRVDPSFNDLSFRARGLIPIASTTMAVNHDYTEVIGYTQTLHSMSAGKESTREYSRDKIMHLGFDFPAGKVEGYTPLYGMPLHLELLWLLWSNQYDFQERGNHPDLVVTAEKLAANRASYDKVMKDLQSYNMPGNSKHGTLLLTGDDFKIEQLQRMDTLQFKEVGMFISSLIASVFHYPQQRLSIKTEESSKSKDSSGGSERFYYNIVSQKQDIMTDLENSMFWIPYFGVRIVQNKSYMHDQVEEGTAQQIRLGNLNTMMQMLDARGNVMNTQKILDIYNNNDVSLMQEDLESGKLQGNISSPTGDRLSNQDATGRGMSRQDRAVKRTEELQRESQDGRPNGATR